VEDILTVGKWYYTVKCSACNKSTPITEAPSPEEVRVPEIGDQDINVTCLFCGESAVYRPQQVRRSRAKSNVH
jgi:ribosomal protein S27E